MQQKTRAIIEAYVGVVVPDLQDETDLYGAGMKSFAATQLMLALEEAYEVEFPEHLMQRETFRTAAAIEDAIRSLAPEALAA